jgi:hypothetical protein
MNFLIPHQFKKIGAIIAPAGFIFWLLMQYGVINKALIYIFGAPSSSLKFSLYHITNAFVALVSFLSFLAGMYFLSFSKEKIEDEMIKKLRLDSFQFAAFIQIVFIISGFISMLIFGSPNDGLLELFFISALFTFWLAYIARFNYAVNIQTGNEE